MYRRIRRKVRKVLSRVGVSVRWMASILLATLIFVFWLVFIPTFFTFNLAIAAISLIVESIGNWIKKI